MIDGTPRAGSRAGYMIDEVAASSSPSPEVLAFGPGTTVSLAERMT